MQMFIFVLYFLYLVSEARFKMSPPKKKPKKSYKVKVFKPEWLEDYLDGVQVKSWLTADPTSPNRARCMVCPAPANSLSGFCSFSIGEGFSAIKTHGKSQKHQKAEENKDQNRNEIPPAKQMRIEQSLKNQEEMNKAHRKQEDQILKGQILLSNMLHSHGIPSKIFTCFAEQAPKIFPDSPIAQKWATGKTGFRSTKADYFATHGIYPHQLQKTIENLRSKFFSINFDETSINGESQLAVNVSYPIEGNMLKENLITIDMKAGTTAEEIVEIVLGKLEEYLIPLDNIIFVSIM